ncbi:MAG TPA: hypothetical protein VGL26_03205 [Jatrophihabitans sp.]|jgi:hypothetical protein
MRTIDDLHGAFSALVREGDAYLAERVAPSGTAEDVPVGEEVPLSLALGPRRRRPVLWLTAAAVAAAVALGTTAFIQARDATAPANGNQLQDDNRSDPLSPTELMMPVTVDPSAGVQIIGWSVRGATRVLGGINRQLRFADSAHDYELVIGPQITLPSPPDWARLVDINGIAAYFYGAAIAPSDELMAYERMPSLQWHLADGTRMALSANDSTTEAQLLELARALRFEGTTVVRSVLRLSVAPDGMRLAQVGVQYRDLGGGMDGLGKPPFNVTSSGWSTYAIYQPLTGDGIEIEASTVPAVTTATDGVEHVTLPSEQTALWYPREHGLTVNLGGGQYLNVSDLEWGANPTVSYDDIVKAASTATVVSNPSDRAAWPAIDQAVPLGE